MADLKVHFTTDTAHAQCELCRTVAELRPYGPNGENICVDCGRKDKAGTEKRMAERMKQSEVPLSKLKDLFKGKTDA